MSLTNSNFINLIGYLGGPPMSKTMPSGQMLTEFRLATNDAYKDRNGNKVERTEWHNVKAFGKAAEVLNQYLDRGSKVSIVGTLRYNNWLDKYEQKRTKAEIIVESFQFMDGPRKENSHATPSMVGEPLGEPIDARTEKRLAKETMAVAMADESDMPKADDNLPF